MDGLGSRTKGLPGCVALVLCFLPAPGRAHHAYTSDYLISTAVEVDGEIAAIRWGNPHVHIAVRAMSADGTIVTWQVESFAATMLSRAGLTDEVLRVGERLRFAGWAARGRSHRLYATRFVLPDGREIVIGESRRQRRR